MINVYSGSLSLSSFFARVVGFVPGRAFWVVSAAVLALVAMLSNILAYVGPVLTFQGIFMFAWAASMLADLLVVKRWLKIGGTDIEYRETHLRAWNPVGPVALVCGSLVGVLALLSGDPVLTAASAFVAGTISFVVHVVVAVLTRGRLLRAAEPGETHPWVARFCAVLTCTRMASGTTTFATERNSVKGRNQKVKS